MLSRAARPWRGLREERGSRPLWRQCAWVSKAAIAAAERPAAAAGTELKWFETAIRSR
jgi:hypothetical protein